MRNLDFSSWQTLLMSFVGIAVVTVIGIAIRLLVMQTVQHRRDRENRQINERFARSSPPTKPWAARLRADWKSTRGTSGI